MGGSCNALLVLCLVLLVSVIYTQDIPLLKASQCFKSRGIPKVQFDCRAGHMIKISRAFHGIKNTNPSQAWEVANCEPSPGKESVNCTYCPGDCTDDSMNLVYDWSTCMGNRSCIRTVMQSYMPTCKGKNSNKKFSDYLQVEYQCVPKPIVYDVCQRLEKTVNEGYVMSPNYPYNYPTNRDCMCKLSTQWESRIILSLIDLLLETKNSRCRADWMMLRQNNQKHRHCGAIMTGVKNITSVGNSLSIQFHSDRNDNRTQKFQYFTRTLKGFWMSFTAEPRAPIRMHCRTLSPADAEVREIGRDDAEYDEIISTREFETTSPLTTETNELDMRPKQGRDKPRRKHGSKFKHPLAERGERERSNKADSGAGFLTMSTCTLAALVYTSMILMTQHL